MRNLFFSISQFSHSVWVFEPLIWGLGTWLFEQLIEILPAYNKKRITDLSLKLIFFMSVQRLASETILTVPENSNLPLIISVVSNTPLLFASL